MKLKSAHVRAAVAVAISMCASSAALAQFAKPDDAVKYRQGSFRLLGTHFGRLSAMAQGKVPFDAKAAAENAEVMTMMSRLAFTAFPESSAVVEGTKAKPQVWAERPKFDESATTMQTAVMKLTAATRGGNFDEIKAAAGEAGKSCKACHDSYKEK